MWAVGAAPLNPGLQSARNSINKGMFPSHCQGETLRQAGPEGKRLRQREEERRAPGEIKAPLLGKQGMGAALPHRDTTARGARRRDAMGWDGSRERWIWPTQNSCIASKFHISRQPMIQTLVFLPQKVKPQLLYIYISAYIYISLSIYMCTTAVSAATHKEWTRKWK